MNAEAATRSGGDAVLVLLPGLDGSGRLFEPLLPHLPLHIEPLIVRYPPDEVLSYDDLAAHVMRRLPEGRPFVVLGESFSGPVALRVASHSPEGLRGVILCASFIRNPMRAVPHIAAHLVRPMLMRFQPPFVRLKAVVAGYASSELNRLLRAAHGPVRPEVAASRVRELLRVDATRELVACNVPIMYLAGRSDRVVRRHNIRAILEVRPEVEVAEVEAPHLVLQTAPAEAAAAIVNFVTKTAID